MSASIMENILEASGSTLKFFGVAGFLATTTITFFRCIFEESTAWAIFAGLPPGYFIAPFKIGLGLYLIASWVAIALGMLLNPRE